MRIGIIISVVLEIFKIPVFTIFETDEWNANRLYEQFSSKIVGDINRFTLFGFQKNNSKYLWEVFKKSSNHDINTQNNYKLIEVDGLVEYREYIEDVEIKSLVFEEDYY